MDMAKKAEEMLRAIGREAEAEYAFGIYREMREVIRRELVDFETMTVSGACQTSQSAALYYGVFEEEEREAAFLRLLDFIKEKNNKIASGVLGLHCIFAVLSDFGYSNLAYEMIMADEYPSYAELIKNGETAMVEKFMPEYSADVSHNHHFLGDISRWFINNVAGLNVVDSKKVRIKPMSIPSISFAEAFYELPQGRVEVRQARDEKGKLKITVTAPDGVEIIRD
jgi:alpha-L-rhamnosidase